MITHPVLLPGRVAVVTGAGHGIGKAAAKEFARIGMKVAIADVNKERLNSIRRELVDMIGAQNVVAVPTDVSDLDQVVKFKEKVYDAWGEVGLLMNNVGIRLCVSPWDPDGPERWKKVFNVNVLGMIHIQHIFIPLMLRQDSPSIIINCGSKRGITNPPGDVLYSASKAAVKSLTESLAHELRELPACNVTSHLFTAGNTWTGLTGDDDTGLETKPDGAWTPQESISYMLDRVRQGEFYIIGPDNETSKEVDQLRIIWSARDIAEGRPPLSRWHEDYRPMFQKFIDEHLSGK